MSTGEFSYKDVVNNPMLAAHLARLMDGKQGAAPEVAAEAKVVIKVGDIVKAYPNGINFSIYHPEGASLTQTISTPLAQQLENWNARKDDPAFQAAVAGLGLTSIR